MPWQVSLPNTWSGAKGGDLATCKFPFGQPEEPARPLHSTFSPAHVPVALHERIYSTEQYTAFLLNLASRGQIAKFLRRREGLLPSSLGVRSTRATSFNRLVSASGLLLVPAGTTSLLPEITITGPPSMPGSKGANLVQQSGLSQGRITNGPRTPRNVI